MSHGRPSIAFFVRAGRAEAAGALRAYAARRLSFALRPYRERVQDTVVRLIDLNGPRRGVDCRCSISATLRDGRRIFVEATDAWPFAAITSAARRLNEAIRRSTARASRRPAGRNLVMG